MQPQSFTQQTFFWDNIPSFLVGMGVGAFIPFPRTSFCLAVTGFVWFSCVQTRRYYNFKKWGVL